MFFHTIKLERMIKGIKACFFDIDAIKLRKIEAEFKKSWMINKRKLSASEAFCSASFQVFLPNMNYKDHHKNFMKVFFNSSLAKYERLNFKLIDTINDEDFVFPNTDKGFIIAGFHYGSYHLISSYLIKNNKKFIVAVNETVAVKKNIIDESNKGLQEYKKAHPSIDIEEIQYLSVQDELFVFKAKELLNEGFILLMFVDGNSGLDGIMKFESKNRVELSFMGQVVKVKYGLPSLSYAFNVPILPVISTRIRKNKMKITSFDLIYPDRSMSREDFSKSSIINIYKILEKVVKANPLEWDGWLYIHRWLDITNLKATENQSNTNKKLKKLKFNSKKYAFFSLGENNFLLDKNTHLSYEIDADITDVIFSKNVTKCNRTIIQNCIEKNILI